jgi:hypothetical protein
VKYEVRKLLEMKVDSKTMLKTKLPKGMIFENQAKLGSKPNWKIVPAPDGWGKKLVAPGKHGLILVDA